MKILKAEKPYIQGSSYYGWFLDLNLNHYLDENDSVDCNSSSHMTFTHSPKEASSMIVDELNHITSGQGFGGTIRTVNGDLECDGANPNTVNARVKYYREYCDKLGVDPGNNIRC
ncbi:endochitinase CHI-like [Olea europaea var. sylvestris]|uniref:endochitinase CHI-like n=1 Tax=Olea europaea var. sylvestris TaxID=158386 RepID=UPI000C1CF07B|nr:endochitinase CHI-like [Olea europaea var. sylvestris]